MSRKILNKGSSGSGTEFGADDTDKINLLLTGADQSATDPVDINTQWRFRDNKLYLRNPANTFAYIVRTSAIGANREISLPLLTANDTVVFNDFAATLANKLLAAARVTNYLDFETGSAPSNPGSNILRVYRDPADNIFKVKKSDGTVVDLESGGGGGAGAHNDTHTAGQSDAFTKSDILAARARYVEDVADPTSDNTRIWIENATKNLKYWDDQASPVKQTVEIQANKGIANGYCDLDASGLVPVSRIAQGQTINYIPRFNEKSPFGFTNSSATGGYGLWNGSLASTGTYSLQSLSSGISGEQQTGAVSGNQSGFRTTMAFVERQHNFALRGSFSVNTGSETLVKGFIGFVNETAAFRAGTNPLNAKSGIGIAWDTTVDGNFKIAHNDGAGATVLDNWSTTTAITNALNKFTITADETNTRFTVLINALTASNISTDIPAAGTELAFQCFIETATTAARNMTTQYVEGETKTRGA